MVDQTRTVVFDRDVLEDLLRGLADAECENGWRWAQGDCRDHAERPPCWRCGAREILES